MIIFGTRGKVVSGSDLEQVACPNCGKSSHASFGILRYFHIFWIPVFPFKKQAGIECLHCKQTLIGKEIPQEIAQTVKGEVFTKKAVLPMFSGLIILAILFLFGVQGLEAVKKQDAKYLANPKVNDYYIVDCRKLFKNIDPKHPYGILKISHISGNQLEMQVGNYGYKYASDASKAIREGRTKSSGYYASETIAFNLNDLKKMKENEIIRMIKRN